MGEKLTFYCQTLTVKACGLSTKTMTINRQYTVKDKTSHKTEITP